MYESGCKFQERQKKLFHMICTKKFFACSWFSYLDYALNGRVDSRAGRKHTFAFNWSDESDEHKVIYSGI